MPTNEWIFERKTARKIPIGIYFENDYGKNFQLFLKVINYQACFFYFTSEFWDRLSSGLSDSIQTSKSNFINRTDVRIEKKITSKKSPEKIFLVKWDSDKLFAEDQK